MRRRLNERDVRVVPDEDARGRAAVAAILRPSEEAPEILFIKRAEKPQDPWSGHMAFPGGRQEPGDPSLVDTAMRETVEEIGLDLRLHGELLGRLDDVQAIARGKRTGLVIAPYVFALREAVDLYPNHEVDELHWASLGPLLRGDVDAHLDYPWQGTILQMPGYRVGERIVWGLTYQMLQLLFARLRG